MDIVETIITLETRVLNLNLKLETAEKALEYYANSKIGESKLANGCVLAYNSDIAKDALAKIRGETK